MSPSPGNVFSVDCKFARIGFNGASMTDMSGK